MKKKQQLFSKEETTHANTYHIVSSKSFIFSLVKKRIGVHSMHSKENAPFHVCVVCTEYTLCIVHVPNVCQNEAHELSQCYTFVRRKKKKQNLLQI